MTILHRLEKEPDAVAKKFADIKGDEYYAEAVAWAAEENIVEGYEDGSFGANDNVTREALATILYRYAKATDMDTNATASLSKFSDSAQVSDWACDAMEWAVGSGLMKGNEDGTINPTGTATRAEVATVIMRLIEMSVR